MLKDLLNHVRLVENSFLKSPPVPAISEPQLKLPSETELFGHLIVLDRNRQIRHPLSGVVVEKANLVVTRPARHLARDQGSQFVHLVPRDQTSLDPFPEGSLFILGGLLDRIDNDDLASFDGGI